MATILLAEDSSSIREAVTVILESEFHTVVAAADGCAALNRYRRERPELVILDVVMPKMNGLDVCRAIRASDTTTPIMFLSAKGAEMDKVLGLGLGADDYLAKPFGVCELIARTKALLRRNSPASVNRRFVRFRIGTAVMLADGQTLSTSEGRLVSLTSREGHLLELLHSRIGEVVPKDELEVGIWGAGYRPESRSLDQILYTLRRKVAGNGFTICTVMNSGLRLVDMRDEIAGDKAILPL